MNPRNTWAWLLIGAVLFAFIYFHEGRRHAQNASHRILSRLDPAAVTLVQVRPAGPPQLEIRAERTNHTWQLTQAAEPNVYQADDGKIENLLETLARLSPAAFISPAELRSRPKGDEEFGFGTPEASLMLSQGDYRVQVNLGAKTAPGDQLFLQVVGIEGVYVVSSDLLKLIPRTANDWRDTHLVPPAAAYDWLAVTNTAKGFSFVARREGPDHLWRLVWPFTWGARADSARLDHCLAQLEEARIRQFVTDDPKAALDPFGLAPGQLELALGQGPTNALFLQFGKSPTNASSVVYARRDAQSVFLVPKDPLIPWQREVINDFRDPHLLTVTEPVERISARGKDPFVCEAQANGQWRILPEDLPADSALLGEFLSTLTNAAIVQFVKDVVNPPELPEYGLAPPLREYSLEVTRTNSSGLASNTVVATLEFGREGHHQERVFARRTDEASVYAISTNDFARLPAAGWQLRRRDFWDFSETNVTRVTIRQQGKTREVVHEAPYHWALAPGSAGVINDLAIEATVRGLAHAAVVNWVARGEAGLAEEGITARKYELILELKNGDKKTIQFGKESGDGSAAVAVSLDGKLWIGEFPASLYAQILYCLTIP